MLPEQKACLGAIGNIGPHLTLMVSALDENRQAFLEESFHYESHDGRFKDHLRNQRTRQLSMQKPRFTSGQSGKHWSGQTTVHILSPGAFLLSDLCSLHLCLLPYKP